MFIECDDKKFEYILLYDLMYISFQHLTSNILA